MAPITMADEGKCYRVFLEREELVPLYCVAKKSLVTEWLTESEAAAAAELLESRGMEDIHISYVLADDVWQLIATYK